jgi:ParB-like chromosome segregation protein Spo0J
MGDIVARARKLFAELDAMDLDERVESINAIREALAERSPFASHPVVLVRWVRATDVVANSYNPNTVAPPEMELLRLSIESDGYTQPVVANREATGYEVVDGFHRSKVGKESVSVKQATLGYLPVVQIRASRGGVHDRMAATIRHNRARGKHGVTEMSAIVLDLTRRGWSSAKVAKELGMDPDEVLRLKQITGLAELFADREFSKAWIPSDE